MKVIVILLVLIVLGWLALYNRGGYATFDPTEQGRKVKAAINPGMPYEQVFDLAGDPKKFRIINRKVEKIAGEEVEVFVPSAEVSTDRARIKARVNDKSLPHGFVVTYNYSAQAAFNVFFDGVGGVAEVTDAVTMADLLDTRQP